MNNPLLYRNKTVRREAKHKELLLTIMLQLALNKKGAKHIWNRRY